ncbi:hypothetical protein VI34_03645 [Methylophilales bacterium MBRSG12]|uniref:Surface-adhesin protein E-like domain-containing protein n=1 Tax=Methylophilales bacterium MBRS-H7 TaxID=1623450 RepID=A0A0H4IZA3_9PROT|nr:hypothetical protein UZ34_06680 [Methylophilales bacterium MBRSF5]AKO65824.1 hypothetical protein VI33_03645 [Methylophilales bacterium MBRS-H7]AKO67144.1 hypothetical protein VI34_03645 [Methylophilales bacterium MBRSG12]
MILRTLIFCFTLLSISAHAEFEFVTTNEDLDEIYFIDLSTLDILKNDHKTVQVLINYQNGFITNNSTVAFSALEENIYDCNKDTIENNFIEYYSETNARGDMVYKNDELSEFIVDFDSPEYRIKEKICN